jgi:hypothetical protein
MLLAQIELRKGVPCEVTPQIPYVPSSEAQGATWTEAMGGY